MSILYTPRTWTTGEVVTAAFMNNEIGTPFTGLQAAWSSYTPTWTGSTTNPVLGNGTMVGRYNQVGKTVNGDITIVGGTTTTWGSGTWNLTLPTNTATTTNRILLMHAYALDSSASASVTGIGKMNYAGANAFSMLIVNVGGGTPNLGTVTNLVPMTWATSDQLVVRFHYESA